jgi:N-acetylglutamate synthase-like GNAT family acetyltransferase
MIDPKNRYGWEDGDLRLEANKHLEGQHDQASHAGWGEKTEKLFSHIPENDLNKVKRFGVSVKIAPASQTRGVAQYDETKKVITIPNNVRENDPIITHEFAHALDHALGWVSHDPRYINVVPKKLQKILKTPGRKYGATEEMFAIAYAVSLHPEEKPIFFNDQNLDMVMRVANELRLQKHADHDQKTHAGVHIAADVSETDVDNWNAQLESLDQQGVKLPADYKQFMGNFMDDIADLDSKNSYVALRKDTEAIGMAAYKNKGGAMEIDYLAVSPINHPRVTGREKGLGSRLFLALIKHAQKKNVNQIRLTSLNADSDIFYRQFGMHERGKIDGHTVFVMDKAGMKNALSQKPLI